MLSSRISKKSFPARNLQPVLPLVPEALPGLEEDKSQFISLELKTRAGGPATSTYKKYVRKFEEGTPQQWIELLKDFDEIWQQNSINGGADRTATVRSLLRGDSLTAFNTALEDERIPEEGGEGEAPLAITAEMVTVALAAVTKTVFPHRALEIQRLWMQRGLRKPMSLTTRKTAAAITKINNALPLFPNGSEASKFSEIELIGILEWSLPQAWRMKFDLDGYVPTEHSKARLIEACEAIERNQDDPEEAKKKKKSSSSSEKKKGKGKDKGTNNDKKFYCTLHGWNKTHATDDCFSLNKKKSSSGGSSGGNSSSTKSEPKKFSNTKFRKELNVLSKSTNRQELLEQYAAAIAKEKKRLKKSNKRKTLLEGDDSSESDESVDVIEVVKPKTKKTRFCEQTAEEKSYLQQIREDSDSSSSD